MVNNSQHAPKDNFSAAKYVTHSRTFRQGKDQIVGSIASNQVLPSVCDIYGRTLRFRYSSNFEESIVHDHTTSTCSAAGS